MSNIRFNGINLSVTDPVKSFAFYKGLGLEVAETAADDDEWYGASFKIGESGGEPCLLWIWRKHDDIQYKNLIVLDCDDIEASYKELKSKGYDVNETEMQFYGGKEMKLVDPDGNDLLFLG